MNIGKHLANEAYKALRKYPDITACNIFSDPDPLLVMCMKRLLKEGFYLALACRASVALKREYDQ